MWISHHLPFPVAVTDYRLRQLLSEPESFSAGGARPLREKQLPEILDMFGWCTWDAFYSNVSARGAGPWLARAAVYTVAGLQAVSRACQGFHGLVVLFQAYVFDGAGRSSRCLQ